ncbi:MAG: serine hydrolase domain-containing protein [Vicinamibacterales bacterium]
MPPPFSAVIELLIDGVRTRAFPAAAIEVGGRAGVLWRRAVGALSYREAALPTTADTIFDLASLTKVIATASLAMRAVDDQRLALEDRVAEWIPAWTGSDREHVTIADLLEHASGLTAYLPFYVDHTRRIDFEPAICGLPLEYPPRTRSIYSDLGFILLGFILEDAQPPRAGYTGAPGTADPERRLQAQFGPVARSFTGEPLAFNPPRSWRDRTAPTEVDPWRGRLLVGEVHDENAWALGGAGGHAGLFGTVGAVGDFARAVLATITGTPTLGMPETMRRFMARSAVPGSSRALGWDTMLPTSSCGRKMSASAIGHTGFTGTSLWIDWERDLYVALLTNRVHPSRDAEQLRALRPHLHDAAVEAFDRHFR